MFVLSPVFTAEPMGGREVQGGATHPTEGPLVLLNVRFGPPAITTEDGVFRTEPPRGELRTQRLVRLPAECAALSPRGRTFLTGRVRLRVDASGNASVVELTEGTGEWCGDEALTTVADALRYRWLPDERFPAPVELVQPVMLAEVEE